MHDIKRPRTVTTTAPRELRLHLDQPMTPTPEQSLGALARGYQRLATDMRAVERERDAAIASLREMVGLYSGMDAKAFWSDGVKAKVLRARTVLEQVDHRDV